MIILLANEKHGLSSHGRIGKCMEEWCQHGPSGARKSELVAQSEFIRLNCLFNDIFLPRKRNNWPGRQQRMAPAGS